jgi:RimJ/RimL family protein N-acetyltransferase
LEHRSSTRMLAAPTDAPFDGDAGWRVARTLPDGVEVTIRPIAPSDRDELQRGFSSMSPRSRYLRFLGVASALSESTLDYLTRVDQHDHVALVATVASPDLKSERGVGVARFIRVKDDETAAEAAITVIDEWQRRGVGTILAVELGRAARAMGVHTIRAEVVSDNATMIAILEAAGASRVDRGEDGGTFSYDLELEPEPFGERLQRVLRGAAQTFGLGSRLLRLPSAPEQ